MEPSGKQVGKTEANIVLTVNIRVRKLSERRFGGYDSNSSVRFYPPWSGGAADSALFISTQLQIGGVERNPGPEYNGDSPGEDARTPFNWSQLCATAYPIYDCQRFSGTNNVQPAIIRSSHHREVIIVPTDEVTKCQVSDVVNAASVMPVLEDRVGRPATLGISNLDTRCYLIATVQILANTPAWLNVVEQELHTKNCGLGLDNKCLLCLLEQCILECLQMRSNAIPYFESLYVKLIEEANLFEHGRQVCFYRHVYVVMKERCYE